MPITDFPIATKTLLDLAETDSKTIDTALDATDYVLGHDQSAAESVAFTGLAIRATADAAFAASADKTKLDGVEALADVTDAANVASAGALMRAGGEMSGNITMAGAETVDGRDLSVDGAKLDGIATSATNTPLTASAPASTTKAAAAVGVATDAARSDHKHDVSTAAPPAAGVGTASGEGVATTLARSDHTHQSNTTPSTTVVSTAAIGVSTQPARADHRHNISTAAPSGTAVRIGNTAATGTSTAVARSDHSHTVAAGVPVALTDATSAEGSAVTFARSDHQHSHGTRAGGTLHAVAVASVSAGFISAADQAKLDAVEAAADVTDATNVAAAGALMLTGGAMTGAITTSSTFDGRDVATDGAKLDTLGIPVASREETGTTYTLADADHGLTLKFTNVSGCVITVPTGLANGFTVLCMRSTAAAVTFDSGSAGITFENPASYTADGPGEQNKGMVIEVTDTNTVTVHGDL